VNKTNLCIIPLLLVFGNSVANDDHSAEDESSFKAPLVQQSLLLDINDGNSSIIVGERGHVLVNQKLSGNDNKADDAGDGAAADNAADGTANTATNSAITPAVINDGFTQVIVPTKATLTAVTSLGDKAWAVGHDASILGSQDAGQTWQLLQEAPELDRPFLDVHFFDPNEGIAVGAYGIFYRTEDGGVTWEQERHASVLSSDDKEYLDSIRDDEDFYLEELAFISPHFNRLHDANGVLYMAGEAGLVASSTDKGRNWERLELNYLGSFFDVAELPNKDILAVGLRGNIFLLTEGDWVRLPSCITTSLNSVFIDDSKVYIAGNNGVILQLDMSKLDNSVSQQTNSEGCAPHAAIAQIPTDFSDAISSAIIKQNVIIAATSAGLKTVELSQ